MKRLYIALGLLAAVAALCVGAHLYLHSQTDRMLNTLNAIEDAARRGDTATAIDTAHRFAAEYRQVSDRISCYVAHSELRESRETAALLPTLLEDENWEELYMEIARLRSQMEYIRQVDDPLLRNIL